VDIRKEIFIPQIQGVTVGPAGREAGQRQGEVSLGKKNGATRDCRDAANAYGGRKRMGKEREDGASSPRRRGDSGRDAAQHTDGGDGKAESEVVGEKNWVFGRKHCVTGERKYAVWFGKKPCSLRVGLADHAAAGAEPPTRDTRGRGRGAGRCGGAPRADACARQGG
jgi:hypothetical protein